MNVMEGYEVNGYKWISHYKGVHSFQRKSEDGYRWCLIQCTQEQLKNGDIEFMTEYGWTLSKERIRQTHRNYDNNRR